MTTISRRQPTADLSNRTEVGPITPAATVDPRPDAALPATSVHPLAVAIPVAAFAWFVLAAWIAFAGGETSLVLAVVTFLGVMYFGGLVGGGAFARSVTPERARTRRFADFLDGDVDIATGRISGRAALWQIAAMPVALAIGATIIFGCAAWVGI